MKIHIDRQVIILFILASLINGEGTARLMYKLVKRYYKEKYKDQELKELQEQGFRTLLSRLKRAGLVENPRWGIWKITTRGKKEIINDNAKKETYAAFRKEHSKERSIIVMFDIPEALRKKRDYLRLELVALGFHQLQKSVWIGGGPLPKEFMSYIKDIDVIDYMHIVSIKEQGTIH